MSQRLVMVALVALLAALPAYYVLRRSRRGRARSAIGYLAGFFSGLAVTAIVAFAAGRGYDKTLLMEGGLLGCFLGPLAGMAWAKARRSRRQRARAE